MKLVSLLSPVHHLIAVHSHRGERKCGVTRVQLKIENRDFCINLPVLTSRKCNLHSPFCGDWTSISGNKRSLLQMYYHKITHTNIHIILVDCHGFVVIFCAPTMRKKDSLIFVLQLTHGPFYLPHCRLRIRRTFFARKLQYQYNVI